MRTALMHLRMIVRYPRLKIAPISSHTPASAAAQVSKVLFSCKPAPWIYVAARAVPSSSYNANSNQIADKMQGRLQASPQEWHTNPA